MRGADQRRAIQDRTREIVAEHNIPWALARDQAVAELGDGPQEPDPSTRTEMVLQFLAMGVSTLVVAVPVGFVLGFALFMSCGTDECEANAGLVWRLWCVLTLGVIMVSGILAHQRKEAGWLAVPILVSIGSAVLAAFVFIATQ